MTLYEYISNITANGTRVVMPRMFGYESRQSVGEPGNNVTKVMWLSEKTREERRKKKEDTGLQLKKIEDILAKVTLAAFNSVNSEQFYRKCFAYAEMDVRNGAYEKGPWDILLMDLVTEIANRLTEVAYAERNMKGARTMIDMLTARVEAWQKKANVQIEKDAENGGGLSVTFNIK